jgi:hypothetical protein
MWWKCVVNFSWANLNAANEDVPHDTYHRDNLADPLTTNTAPEWNRRYSYAPTDPPFDLHMNL